jgi:DNA-binding LacI/PurR family transcriptional regulator
VAERAGVSTMTVSRVLSGHPDVAPITRDSVLRHARALGYRTPGAHHAARRRTGLIALTVPFITGEGSFFGEIVAGAAEAVAQHGANLVLCPTRHEHDREVTLLDRLLHGRTDGALLVSPSESPAELAGLAAQGHPFVVIDPTIPPGDGIPVVAAMNTRGARSATEHLIALGHRRIAAITGPAPWAPSVDRLAGYHAALAAAGLPVVPELVAQGDFTIHSGEAAAHQLLLLPEPPTAIFAFNDNMAVGALVAATAHRLAVPRDLSVAGFDDIEAASLVTPALSTVRQPLREMGRSAVGLLIRLLEGRPIEAPRIEVATRLIVRASTGAAPAHPGREDYPQ